ncbi:MAG: DNA primase [Planctomycetes bacterium]|nr:DNA primase [Planctomycetota bacterium]
MAGMFDNTVVYQVQQANDIVDVVSEHVSLVKKGREMAGLCPFHEDHRPSMYVNGVKQIFKCFACGAGGDVFKFVQMRENLTFPQAIERLAERAGIKIKPMRSSGRAKDKSQEVDPNRLAKANLWASEHFQKILADKEKGKSTREYLAERQINDESIKKWQIGLSGAGNDLVQAARAKNASMDLLFKAGLSAGQNKDKFVNRLMFAITDVTGRVIGFGGRTLDGSGAKYLNSPTTVLFDKSNCLYGLEQARHEIVSSGVAVIVEGYTDCIMAHQMGCKNVVATLGTSFTMGHARILKRYAQKVVLLYDSDIAGMEAANRALEVCLSQHIDIKLAFAAEGNDPCDFLLASGKEAFDKLIAEATDVFEFKWQRLKDKFSNEEGFSGRKTAIEEFLQTIATSLQSGNLSAIDGGLIANRLSSILGIETKELNKELSKRMARAARSASYNVENQSSARVDLGDSLAAKAQREVLEVLLNEPGLFENVEKGLSTSVFDVPMLKQVAVILFEALQSKKEVTLAEILSKAESVEVGNCIVELAEVGEKKGNFESRLSGALEVIERIAQQGDGVNIEEINDPAKYLRQVSKKAGERNQHNIGMV